MKRREVQEILRDIKNNNWGFDEDDFFQYAKINVEFIHKAIRDREYDSVRDKVSKKVIDKLINEDEKFRTNRRIDHISVQYIQLYDYTKSNHNYIKLYMSVYIYDNTRNNFSGYIDGDKYWNDIWIVTYKETKPDETMSLNCENCGAPLRFAPRKNVLKCEYCGGKKYFNDKYNMWVLDDIEIKN